MSAPEPLDATFVDLLTPHVPLPGQLFCRVDLNGNYGEDDNEREITSSVEGASLITSYMGPELTGMHRPVLDLDMPAALVPSSTPGHFHLYIDKPMTWEVYAQLLEALAAAGIVEQGYVSACLERGHSAVRLPWVRKAAT